jgi:hypothetical protein
MSTPGKTQAGRLIDLAYEAVTQGQRVRVSLWDGTGPEGKITKTSEGDDQPHAMALDSPTAERLLGPMPRTITIDAETIAVSEIAQLELIGG